MCGRGYTILMSSQLLPPDEALAYIELIMQFEKVTRNGILIALSLCISSEFELLPLPKASHSRPKSILVSTVSQHHNTANDYQENKSSNRR